MRCPHCQSKKFKIIDKKTVLSYKQYYCNKCYRQYNERSGTKLNFIEYPTEVVMLVVYHYYRFKVSLDDVVELMAMRGIHLSHQTVHNWTQTFGVELGLKIRKKRKGKAGKKLHVDATYLKIEGRWCYLYRAIDKEGNLVDVYLSDVRDQVTAEKFFKQMQNTMSFDPEQITTDKEKALYPAIENTFNNTTKHRDSKFMNNIIEQDHRGIKSRYKVMKGFKNIFSALIFCTAFEEIRQFFRMKNKTRAEKRKIIAPKIKEFNNLLAIAA
ncbi:MAG: IS6 family transposase [archaeon]|nr:IS6 family transposase [archaeon]